MKPKSVAPQSAVMAVDRKLHNTWVYIKRHWQLYLLFLMPAVLLTLVFRYIPMGGVLIAFQKYNPFKGIWGSEWVGFKNFTRFLSSPDFMRYLINTLKLSVYGLLWGFPIPILLAFLLNRIKSNKIKQKVQLVLYMPNFISVIVLCGIVRVLLSVTGPVNGLFHTGINFMTLPEAFRPIYIISGIWQGAGWSSIMYTAALSNASQELKEAAMLDGANLIQQIRTVEWPAIKDMVVIQFILQAGNIMSIGFEKAYALQTDLNLDSAEIIATYVYKKGLLDGDYSFSTAVGLFNTVINVILLIAVNKVVAKMNDGQGIQAPFAEVKGNALVLQCDGIHERSNHNVNHRLNNGDEKHSQQCIAAVEDGFVLFGIDLHSRLFLRHSGHLLTSLAHQQYRSAGFHVGGYPAGCIQRLEYDHCPYLLSGNPA